MEGTYSDALKRLRAVSPKSIAIKLVVMRDEAGDLRVSYKELWEAPVLIPCLGNASQSEISKKLREVIAFCAHNELPVLTTLVVRHGPPRDWSDEAIESICEDAKNCGFSVGLVPKAFVEQQAKLSETITVEEVERATD